MTGTQCRDVTAARRARRALLCGAILTTALAAPSAASAADIVIAPDVRAAGQVTALDGTAVWVRGRYGQKQTLWQKTADGVARVKGAPAAGAYSSVDLGRNSKNKLVLTYRRCNDDLRCKILTDDLKGHRESVRHRAPKGCQVTTALARWRSRSAYGLVCRDEGRTGLYVKTGSKAPTRLPRPADASKFHITDVRSVDLRGTNVAAVLSAGEVYEYAFVQTVQGKNMRSIMTYPGNAHIPWVADLAVGPGGAMWTLTQGGERGSEQRRTLASIFRVANTSVEREDLLGRVNSGHFPASDIAVDGSTVYLAVPNTGIVTHEFAPEDISPL